MGNKVAVIGGGPAGIIAAGMAGSRDIDVTLIEKNERLGKKMFITGKGRCNITNASPIDEFFDYIMKNKISYIAVFIPLLTRIYWSY